MTLHEVLQELLRRLEPGGDPVITWEQMREWPKGALEVFHKAGWIESASSASTVECPGCDEACFMPVRVLPARDGRPASAYVACDQPADLGRIKISMAWLQQWQVTEARVARWVSGALGLNDGPRRERASRVIALGMVRGHARLDQLEFTTIGSVSLRVSGHSLPLSDVVVVEHGQLSMNHAAVLAMVDLPPVSALPMHTSKSLSKPVAGAGAAQPTGPELGSREWRSQTARNAANAKHDQPGGSRDKQRRMRDLWASGKYTSRDLCAEEECAALGMSFAAARKALRNTPMPSVARQTGLGMA